MTYTKTEWVNDSAPDIDASNLNKIEQGILDAHVGLVVNADLAASAKADAGSAVATVNGHVGSVSNPHQTTAKQVGARHHKNAIKRGCVADGTFDNTRTLQTLLDELRDGGGGELYLPNDGNSVYRTRGLWVPSNTRIVSDGAKVYFYDGGAARYESPDGDLGAATGFNCASQLPARGAAALPCNRVLIEGLTIEVASGGFKTFTQLDPTDPFVAYWQANPWAGDPNRRPSNVYPANSLRGLVHLWLAGDDITVRDVICLGTAYDTVQISGNRIHLERAVLSAARRNNVSIFGGNEIHFDKVISNGCLAQIPVAQTANGSWVFQEFAPGCGVEIEPFGATTLEAIRFRACTFKNNGGAGIGVVLDEGGTSTIDGLVIDGCYIAGNGAVGATGNLHGAVELRGGNASHAVFIANSSLKSSARGPGIERDVHSFAARVIVSGCDLRFNAGGVVSGSGYVDGGGNVTA